MKKLATVFLLAVLVPSLVLAWLATRTVREQELIVKSQRALLHQAETEAVATELNAYLDAARIRYSQLVDELITDTEPETLMREFDRLLSEQWPEVTSGAVVTLPGNLLAPQASAENITTQQFIAANGDFLQNRIVAEVYQAPAPVPAPVVSRREKTSRGLPLLKRTVPQEAEVVEEMAVAPAAPRAAQVTPKARTVENFGQIGHHPTEFDDIAGFNRSNNLPSGNFGNVSSLQANRGALPELLGDEPEGAISRFLEDGLHILLWKRHPEIVDRIFWAELDLSDLRVGLTQIVMNFGSRDSPICVALLDAKGEVVARSVPSFETDWRRPFVASEVGEILPHWEVTAYLLDPEAVIRSAGSARFTVSAMIGLLLTLIAVGSGLVFYSVGREMRLARQKTDFVSNVSHELKTPLTSIRLFSELLAKPTDKQSEYAEIINTETTRLTRLINNLLDFAKLDRGEASYDRVPLDLAELTTEIARAFELRNVEATIETTLTIQDDVTFPVEGDRDALAQVILNLLSNAEKYGLSEAARSLAIELTRDDRSLSLAVLDRGPGVPRKFASRIFDKFYRVDDSLSTAHQGTGLGLTLARQIARAHEGDLTYAPRPGGGSVFTLTLPLAS